MADQKREDRRSESIPERGFSEKSFYLDEFRRRTLAIAVAEHSEPALLESVLKELEQNETRAVLISNQADFLQALTGRETIEAGTDGLEGRIWRRLLAAPRAGLLVRPGEPFAAACREISLRLFVSKLLWIDAHGPLWRPNGLRHSFIDLDELREMRRSGPFAAEPSRGELFREIEMALCGGIPAVSLCTLEGLAEELFSYEGSGTLFTRRGYIETRRIGIDDFDAAFDLVSRGVAEGYLAPRSQQDIDQILACGFGAFVGGRHLAGIGALLPWIGSSPRRPVGEIASLYTLTRFLGEGVGGHLVRFAVERARERGCSYVFACTTSDRVGAFFERNHLRRADQREIPPEKWRNYDRGRRDTVQCFVFDLD